MTTASTQSSCIFSCVCAGVSSYTLWQVYSTNGMFMNINTSSCNFNQTPLYFTSLAGSSNHLELIGHNAIYMPTRSSLRIYVTSLPGWSASTLMTYASSYAWNVNWVGTYN